MQEFRLLGWVVTLGKEVSTMDLNEHRQKLNSTRQKYQSMTDIELAQLGNQNNIPHALVTDYGDYVFMRQKLIAKLTIMELEAQTE